MKRYRIVTKDLSVDVVASDIREAWIEFFRMLKEEWENLKSRVGVIALLYDGKEAYPFRTPPTLYNLGLIDEETAVKAIQVVAEVSKKEARRMLKVFTKADGWVVEGIQKHG